MQWLAALCVRVRSSRRVLILSLTVVGVFSFTQLGVDQFPEGRLPDRRRHDGAAGRRARADRNRDHRQDRRSRQHHQRHRRAAVDVVGRRVAASSSRSCSTRTATWPRRKCATRSTASCRCCRRRFSSRASTKFDPDAAPVLSIALTANKPVRDVTEYADKVLRRQIESVNGVGQVLVARRTPAPDQRLARRRPAARLQPHRHRRLARAPGAEHRDPRRPHGSGRAVGHAADARPRPDGRRSSTTSSSARTRAIRSRSPTSRRSKTARPTPTRSPTSTARRPCCCKSAGSRARTRSKSSRASGSGSTRLTADAAGRLRPPDRPRPVGLHRGLDPQRRRAPDRRLDPRRARRAALPVEPALDDHRGHRDPDLDHRHVRPRSGTWASRSTR